MRWLRKLHIYLGLAAALILIVVTLTGVLLLHKKTFGLNEVTVSLPNYPAGVKIEVHDALLTKRGDLLAVGQLGVIKRSEGQEWQVLLETPARKIYSHEDIVYVCGKSGLLESRDQGTSWKLLFDREVLALTIREGTVYIAATDGVYRGAADNPGKWVMAQSYPAKVSEVRSLAISDGQIATVTKEGVFVSREQMAATLEKIPGEREKSGRVDLQKVVKDLHTGDIFGRYFYLVMDLMSASVLITTLSGVYLWFKARRVKR
jgi:hypothetical protein